MCNQAAQQVAHKFLCGLSYCKTCKEIADAFATLNKNLYEEPTSEQEITSCLTIITCQEK